MPSFFFFFSHSFSPLLTPQPPQIGKLSLSSSLFVSSPFHNENCDWLFLFLFLFWMFIYNESFSFQFWKFNWIYTFIVPSLLFSLKGNFRDFYFYFYFYFKFWMIYTFMLREHELTLWLKAFSFHFFLFFPSYNFDIVGFWVWSHGCNKLFIHSVIWIWKNMGTIVLVLILWVLIILYNIL